MARFFFDWHEQGQTIHDDVGVDYPDVEVVRREVKTALLERAHELFRTEIIDKVGITVRNCEGRIILKSYAWIKGQPVQQRRRLGQAARKTDAKSNQSSASV